MGVTRVTRAVRHDILMRRGLWRPRFNPEFSELTPQNAQPKLFKLKPFVLFLLCGCADDARWDVQGVAQLLQLRRWKVKGLHNLEILYVQPPMQRRSSLRQIYGLAPLSAKRSTLVIDNIPLGPMNERYLFDPGAGEEELALPAQVRAGPTRAGVGCQQLY
jgi:hypothetical protein